MPVSELKPACQFAPLHCSAPALLRSHNNGLLRSNQSNRGCLMSSIPSPTQSEFSPNRRAIPSLELSARHDLKTARVLSESLSLKRRAPRAICRFLIVFCLGIAATLGWQSYGDAARVIIANSSEQFGWLAPAPIEQASDVTVPTAVAASSPDIEELKTMSLGLTIMRQNVDQLITGQEQMAREITKLQAAEEDVLQKISEPPLKPPAASAPKGTSPTPSQAPGR